MGSVSDAGAQACTAAVAGKFYPSPLSYHSDSTRFECPAGFYSLERAIDCTGCPAGYKCPNNNVKPQPCESGTFSTGYSAACYDCPAGFFCPSTDMLPSLCPSGHYSLAKSIECTICPQGKECPTLDAADKNDCDIGYYRIYEENGLPYCKECPGGYKCTNVDKIPEACPLGTFSKPGQQDCT